MTFSFKNSFFVISTGIAMFAVLILAKSVLIPIGMALLISFILFPVTKKLEKWRLNNMLAAFLAIFGLALFIGGGITLFSTQILLLSEDISNFSDKLMGVFTDAILFFNKNVSFMEDLKREELLENVQEWLKGSAGSLAKNTFNSTASFITGLVTTIIFTFLFLIYRAGLTKAFMHFASQENRKKVFEMLKKVQEVGQKYLSGMIILIIILGVLNSVGLWIIGIDSPFLFGFLAASLSIIPYIGTTLGATLPVLYAFMTHDSLWIPLAVIGLFWFIQTLEGNFLNPKIVGSSLNVNALAAILSLIIGGTVWGVAGMILFLPFAAMLKVICNEFEQLRPIGMLIGNDISGDKKKEEKASKWTAKFKSWFSSK